MTRPQQVRYVHVPITLVPTPAIPKATILPHLQSRGYPLTTRSDLHHLVPQPSTTPHSEGWMMKQYLPWPSPSHDQWSKSQTAAVVSAWGVRKGKLFLCDIVMYWRSKQHKQFWCVIFNKWMFLLQFAVHLKALWRVWWLSLCMAWLLWSMVCFRAHHRAGSGLRTRPVLSWETNRTPLLIWKSSQRNLRLTGTQQKKKVNHFIGSLLPLSPFYLHTAIAGLWRAKTVCSVVQLGVTTVWNWLVALRYVFCCNCACFSQSFSSCCPSLTSL